MSDTPSPSTAATPARIAAIRAGMRGSLTRTFAILGILAVLLPLLIVFVLAASAAQRQATQQVAEQLESVAALQRWQIDEWLHNRELTLRLLSGQPGAQENARTLFVAPQGSADYVAASARLRELLAAVQASDDTYFAFMIIDARDAHVVLSTDRRYEGLTLSVEDFLYWGKQGEYLRLPSWVVGGQDLYGGLPYIVTARPFLRRGDGSVQAVLVGLVDAQRMTSIIGAVAGFKLGYVHLFDAQGRLVASSDATIVVDQARPNREVQQVITGTHTTLAGRSYTNFAGQPVFGRGEWYTYAWDRPEVTGVHRGLGLFVELPAGIALAGVRNLILIMAGLSVAGVTVVAIGGTLVARTFVRPLGTLTESAVRVASGDLDQTVAVRSSDEFGVLARAFNEMTAQLRRLYTGLEQTVDERTAELARRVGQLNLINRVGRNATSMLALDALLPYLARQIRDAFDHYAVLILLMDRAQACLRLSAAATAEDVDLLAAGLELSLADQSIICHVARTGEPLVVPDVNAEPRYRPEGRLPRTRSELALPLRFGAEVLGVLDLESALPDDFAPEDVQVMQTLADQTAVAIHNALLYAAEAEARRAADAFRAEAEDANRLKSQFLANMSHELRTPLNSIINFAYLLTLGTEGELTPEQADLLNRIGDAGRHLLGLINDILDLAKIEAGRLELYLEAVDLHDVLAGVLSTATGLVRNRPIELRRDIPADLPPVHADRTRVRQVLLNLISNAAKFTERGHIAVRAWADGEWVTLAVEDTGIGIAPEDIPKAFTEFVQIDGQLNRQAGGTGLGLPICKRFVEMHGGRIWVESAPGRGSTFYFTLPCLPPSPPAPPGEPHEARVLVIDDDQDARETIARQLAHGYEVLKLADSRRALEKIREMRPDVVVLDVLMPHQDGWDILRALKEDPATRDIPVVMCSMLHEHKLAFALGAGDYLVKPVEAGPLRAAVARFAPPNGKILAVDDDPNALEIVARLLDGMSYRVRTAEDGRAGLAAVQEQMPDVIVLDLMMPGLSGFEVLAQLRAAPRTAQLPVIVVTAKDLTDEERAQLQGEAATLFQKGQFSAEEFKQAVRRAALRGPAEGTHA